jgi:DNA-binding winged helix-turn-helix (wHTH) protein
MCAMRVQLGAITFDSGRRQLLRGQEAVHLSPKAFSLLELLFERRPRAVSKADIHERLWPGLFVSEANLPSLVNELRVALGDDARRPVFVRTVHGFGYAFAADLPEPPPEESVPRTPFVHRLVWGQIEIDLPEGESVIGREREASIWIADPSVSRRHARIEVRGAEATLDDLDSKNRTLVDGAPVAGRVRLRDGAVIRLGNVTIVFQTISTSASTQTAPDA